jgi:hypothetical protein
VTGHRSPRARPKAPAPAPATSWEPIELEDGILARVSRTMKPGRWRWACAPVDHILKWNRNVTDVPFSKGFSGTRERAIEMAEAAIEALKKDPE